MSRTVPTPLDIEIERIAREAADYVNNPVSIDQATADFRRRTLHTNGGEPVTDEFLRGVMFGAWCMYSYLVEDAEREDGRVCPPSAEFASRVSMSMAIYVHEMRRTLAAEATFSAAFTGGGAE